MTNLWAAVLLIGISQNGVMTYAPFYDLNACLTAQRDMEMFAKDVRAKCVPTVSGNPGRHNVQ